MIPDYSLIHKKNKKCHSSSGGIFCVDCSSRVISSRDVNRYWLRLRLSLLLYFLFSLHGSDLLNLGPFLFLFHGFKGEEFLFETINCISDRILLILVKDVHHVALEILHDLGFGRAILLRHGRQQCHNLVKLLTIDKHCDHAVKEFGRNVGLLIENTRH